MEPLDSPQPDLIGDEFYVPPRPEKQLYPELYPEPPMRGIYHHEHASKSGWPHKNHDALMSYFDVPNIPVHYGYLLKICPACHKIFWTWDGYRGHWLLVHHHKLALD